MTVNETTVGGWVAPGFEPVAEAFAENFSRYGDVGASVGVYVDGEPKVDLWGGVADAASGRPWASDSVSIIYSATKGATAILAALLAQRGQLDFDAPVTRYWPEFAAGGKAEVTVRQLLSHQGGLPALHAPMAAGSMLDWELMASVLAAEEPWWPPGTGHGYHVNTFGFLGGELLRRITGMMPGEFLRREVAGPLSADLHIGLDPADFWRVAAFHWPAAPAAALASRVAPPAGAAAGPAGAAAAPRGADSVPGTRLALSAYFNPPDFSGAGVVNTAAWRAAQVPSANAHATATGIARLYAPLAAGGGDIVDRGALAAATEEQVYGDDLVLQRPSRFGLGFQLTHPEREFGPGPACFGHFGAGGSVGFCDPDAGLAFGYVTNQMGPRWRNPRNRALIEACYSCL
jgi:CubicO group peptidase (beta-lactamase class C family)